MIYSEIVKAFSLVSLFLSRKANSQYLLVKPSAAREIFLSNSISSFDMTGREANISATCLFEHLATE
jgi:hypothetical protein